VSENEFQHNFPHSVPSVGQSHVPLSFYEGIIEAEQWERANEYFHVSMVPCVLHSRYCFCLHGCLVAHTSRLLESRKQKLCFLIACTDLIGWKHLQPFVLLSSKKASDADEQLHTGLGRLEL
jgi:hypothetical protein